MTHLPAPELDDNHAQPTAQPPGQAASGSEQNEDSADVLLHASSADLGVGRALPSAPADPPAHWLARVRSAGPPEHWLAKVRLGAPHLLHAEPTEISVDPPSLPALAPDEATAPTPAAQPPTPGVPHPLRQHPRSPARLYPLVQPGVDTSRTAALAGAHQVEQTALPAAAVASQSSIPGSHDPVQAGASWHADQPVMPGAAPPMGHADLPELRPLTSPPQAVQPAVAAVYAQATPANTPAEQVPIRFVHAKSTAATPGQILPSPDEAAASPAHQYPRMAAPTRIPPRGDQRRRPGVFVRARAVDHPKSANPRPPVQSPGQSRATGEAPQHVYQPQPTAPQPPFEQRRQASLGVQPATADSALDLGPRVPAPEPRQGPARSEIVWSNHHRWPELLAETASEARTLEGLLRAQERQQRLDREQRGAVWNA